MPEPKTTKEDLANILVNLAVELVRTRMEAEEADASGFPRNVQEWEVFLGDEIANAALWEDGSDSFGGPDLFEEVLDPVIAVAARRQMVYGD